MNYLNLITFLHQSSDSGSESGIHSRKSTKLRSGESDINTGSNDEDDIGSIDLNVWDGSDDGSGTQVLLTLISASRYNKLSVKHLLALCLSSFNLCCC